MRLYTVHLGPPAAQGRDVVFVKEGFSWPAFLFTIFWALAKGRWLTAIVIFTAQVALSAAALSYGFAPEAESAASFALLILIGVFANDMQRFELTRNGYEMTGVVAAPSVDAAALRAFDRMPQLSQ